MKEIPLTKGRVALRGKGKNNTSGFKGVTWCKRWKKWEAQIRVHGRNKFLGYFSDKIEAAHIYDRAAIKYFGEFAKTNFVEVS